MAIIAVVAEFVVLTVLTILADRYLSNRMAMIVLAIGLLILGYAHRNYLMGHFRSRKPVAASPSPSQQPAPAPSVGPKTTQATTPSSTKQNEIRSIKNPLEIVAFNSSQDISIANNGPVSIYLIRLLANEGQSSESFGLELEVAAGKIETRHIGLGFRNVRTIDTLADTWQEHVSKAIIQYQNCWQFTYFSASDPGFQQVKDHYLIKGKRLAYDEIQGTLYYKIDGVLGIKEQKIPMVVIVTVDKDTCP
jgi:hypothetical protein